MKGGGVKSVKVRFQEFSPKFGRSEMPASTVGQVHPQTDSTKVIQ
jgi:hypothetical protein